jgi:hypothetical protein
MRIILKASKYNMGIMRDMGARGVPTVRSRCVATPSDVVDDLDLTIMKYKVCKLVK